MIKPSACLYAYLRSADSIYRAGQLNVWERRSSAIWSDSERGSFPFQAALQRRRLFERLSVDVGPAILGRIPLARQCGPGMLATKSAEFAWAAEPDSLHTS
jgi:hypothetical protein